MPTGTTPIYDQTMDAALADAATDAEVGYLMDLDARTGEDGIVSRAAEQIAAGTLTIQGQA